MLPVALEICAVETCLEETSCRNFVYETDLALLWLMEPTSRRTTTTTSASAPQSQSQFCPEGVQGWVPWGELPSALPVSLGLPAGFSVFEGLTASMLCATPGQW